MRQPLFFQRKFRTRLPGRAEMARRADFAIHFIIFTFMNTVY